MIEKTYFSFLVMIVQDFVKELPKKIYKEIKRFVCFNSFVFGLTGFSMYKMMRKRRRRMRKKISIRGMRRRMMRTNWK